jgi:hypothetical protein
MTITCMTIKVQSILFGELLQPLKAQGVEEESSTVGS